VALTHVNRRLSIFSLGSMNPNQPYRSNGRNYGNQHPYNPANASSRNYSNGTSQATVPGFSQPPLGYRQPSGPLPFTPNPNLPPMPDALRIPANSLLPFDAQLRQAEQMAHRPQVFAPPARPAASASEPVELSAPAMPAPVPQADASLRPELGEHPQAAAAPVPAPAPDPQPPVAEPKMALVVEDETDDDNFGNRIGRAPMPTARASAGHGRQQTRAMQSDHQRLGQLSGRPQRTSRGVEPASASQGDAQATSLLRQASLQKPAVQGRASDLRPRRELRGSQRPGYGRQW